MNQTQKKYAINRIAEELKLNLKAIQAKEDAKEQEYTSTVKLSYEEIFAGIQSGEITLTGKKPSSFFDSLDLSKLRATKAGDLLPTKRAALSSAQFKGYDGNELFLYTWHKVVHDKVAIANKLLTQAADEIFLGSEEDALAAITKFSTITL